MAPSGPGVKGARCKSPSCYPRGRRYSLDFARVYDHVARLLDENAFPHAVVGALGLHAYGHSRATFDLDLVTVQAAQPSLVKALEQLGYETLHVSGGYSNHQHADPDWGGLDVIYVDEETAGLLFPRCSRTLRLGSRDAPVPRAEHLAAMKVRAMCNDPSRLVQDLADVQHLLRLPETDRAEVRGYFEKAGILDWYERLLATL